MANTRSVALYRSGAAAARGATPPGWVTRTLSFFWPGLGFQPPAYDAGSTTGPRMGRYFPATSGPNAALAWNLPTLRNRSRDKRRNDGLADQVIEILTTNVIGTGIRPQFQTKNRKLNGDLATAFKYWVAEADADGFSDYYGQQAMAFSSMLEGGDCFGRMRARRLDDGLTVPLQIQLLEGEFCPSEWNLLTKTGYVQQGIEFGPVGQNSWQRVAYYLWRQHPQDMIARAFLDPQNFQPSRVNAEDVIHLANRKRPGQIRGEPWLVRALIKLLDLHQYDDAQLVRQKVASFFAGFVINVQETPFPVDTVNDVPSDADGVAYPSLEPGTMQNLDPGNDIRFSTPPGPGDSYDSYMRHQERRVASTGAVMYEEMTGDFAQMNDRVYRAAANAIRRRYKRMQGDFVFQWCRPSLARWIDLAIISGRVTLPRGVTARDVLNLTTWVPQAWDYINPLQDVQAKRAEIRAGLKPRSQQIIEDGGDPDVIIDQYERDDREADDRGVVFDSDPRYTNDKGMAQKQPAEIEPGEGSDGSGAPDDTPKGA